jgi:rod shape-determining protein MreC
LDWSYFNLAARKEKKWIHGLFAIFISLLLLVTTHGLRFGGSFSDFVTTVLNIPEYPARTLRNNFRDIAVWFTARKDLYTRIKTLEEENIHLRSALSMSDSLSVMKKIDGNKTTARVTFRPPSAWWSECRINKGASNGIEAGQLALQGGMLVGRVAAVEKDHSWIELITSPSLLIPAVVEETRDVAVVKGDGKGGIWLIYLPEDSRVKEGMNINTAMVNEMTPPGIPIGRIADIDSRLVGNSKALLLDMGGDLSRLYEISILPYKGD